MSKNDSKTSWGNVAEWYDDLLDDADSYQAKVILPNLLRIVDPKAGMTILDNACGQGYFAHVFNSMGAKVIGCDVAKQLIEKAQKKSAAEASNVKEDKKIPANLRKAQGTIEFHTTPSHELTMIKNETIDAVTIVLALQNIEKMNETVAECRRVLKKNGRLIIVLNHPAFRIPKSSSWEWADEKQYRRVDAYMSDSLVKVDMSPGEENTFKKKFTTSFHRPLQSYFKAFNKAALAVTRLEEWISHKKSQTGPKAIEEDRMRKEIPLFLCIEAINV